MLSLQACTYPKAHGTCVDLVFQLELKQTRFLIEI